LKQKPDSCANVYQMYPLWHKKAD